MDNFEAKLLRVDLTNNKERVNREPNKITEELSKDGKEPNGGPLRSLTLGRKISRGISSLWYTLPIYSEVDRRKRLKSIRAQ